MTEYKLTRIDSNNQYPAKTNSVNTISNRAAETSFIVENDLQKASSIQSTDHDMVSLNLCTQLPIETKLSTIYDANSKVSENSTIADNELHEIVQNRQSIQNSEYELNSTVSSRQPPSEPLSFTVIDKLSQIKQDRSPIQSTIYEFEDSESRRQLPNQPDLIARVVEANTDAENSVIAVHNVTQNEQSAQSSKPVTSKVSTISNKTRNIFFAIIFRFMQTGQETLINVSKCVGQFD